MKEICARLCLRTGMAGALTLAVLASPARANLVISKQPTKNVSCNSGACVATAKRAVLNVSDLANLLASQSSVSLDAGPAKDMTVKAPLNWTSSTPFALKASGVLSVKRKMTAAGHATVNIQSNGLVFAQHASLTFWDKTSSLTINSHAYALATDPTSLWLNLTHDSLFTALANNIDASNGYGNYLIDRSPGVFEGLGHTISNVSGVEHGLIQNNTGRISNIHVKNWQVSNGGLCAGILVDTNEGGSIDHASATGSVSAVSEAGGLVGCNYYSTSAISHSHARAKVEAEFFSGGLVGSNGGSIESSYAEGRVGGQIGVYAGGLVGEEWGHTKNSYSLAHVDVRSLQPAGYYGGLIGYGAQGSIVSSYAVGEITHHRQGNAALGGVIGNEVPKIACANVYWDFANGVTDPSQGTGNVPNAPGLTGLSDAQLKSGLPAGFDPKIWAQSPNLNSGYPYLLANPPLK